MRSSRKKLMVKAARQSGLPVEMDQCDAFEVEFKEGYDKIAKENKGDMQAMESRLGEFDKYLADKYDTIVEVEMPMTKNAIKKFVKKYGSYMISTHVETKEPMLIIMDLGI